MNELSHAEWCRTLVQQGKLGTLSSHALDPEGYPYGSLVQYAPDAQGDVLLLLSELAEHTQNLQSDPRASLLVWHNQQHVDPLAAGRVTLFGTVAIADPAQLETYLDIHPQARQYAGFKDFRLWKLQVSRLRYVGGFGAMSWLQAAAYHQAQPDPVAQLAAGVINHMNEDHADALLEIVRHRLGRQADKALMVGCDGAGYLVRIDDKETLRLDFSGRKTTSDELRKEFIEQVRQARLA